ncbi:DoxX family protein [Actinokineospora sp. HUAS TT18]|uniref:DoxX family protein n=1 Tax=Actinokineospora sp. HUAS TT18 TaxID=3447451 RepID=UPI003F52697B
MAPLIILIVTTLALFALGRLGVRALRPWQNPLRGGVAAMFTATGIAHFVGMRDELIRMVPPDLPAPELLVTITGILELAGAIGVLWRPTTLWAAAGLSAMLVGMFPANIYAANHGLSPSFGDQLAPRTAMQIVFLAATLALVWHYARARRVTASV